MVESVQIPLKRSRDFFNFLKYIILYVMVFLVVSHFAVVLILNILSSILYSHVLKDKPPQRSLKHCLMLLTCK